MDLTFQVPMQYCSLQHWTLIPSPVTSTIGWCFLFGSVSSFSGVISLLISHSILGSYRPRELIVQCPIILSFMLFMLVILVFASFLFLCGPTPYTFRPSEFFLNLDFATAMSGSISLPHSFHHSLKSKR